MVTFVTSGAIEQAFSSVGTKMAVIYDGGGEARQIYIRLHRSIFEPIQSPSAHPTASGIYSRQKEEKVLY